MSITSEPGLEINVPLLRKTLEHIEAHPEEHAQGVWGVRGLDTPCGTAYCVAGHAVKFAGHTVKWNDPDAEFGANEAFYVVEGLPIREMAQKELGLDGQQARYLFHNRNSRRKIFELANEYTGGEIEIPEKYL